MSIVAPRPTPTIAAASWMWAAVSPTSMTPAAWARRRRPKADSVQSRVEKAGSNAGLFLFRRQFGIEHRRVDIVQPADERHRQAEEGAEHHQRPEARIPPLGALQSDERPGRSEERRVGKEG